MRYFGKCVREARRRAGLSQGQLAKLCGIAQPHISELESGARPVLDTTLERVAVGMGITMHELCSCVPDEQCDITPQ